MNTIIEQIEKETDGELKVRLHLGGSLPINTTNITQAVSDDVVQMGDDGYFTGNVPIGGILRLPMLIRTREEYAKAAAVVDPYLEAAFGKKGLVVLGQYLYPFQVAYSRNKLTSLADFKGQKIRVTSPEQGEFIKRLGARAGHARRARSAFGARPRRGRWRAHRQYRRRQYLEGPAEIQLPARHQLFQFGRDRQQGPLRQAAARRAGRRCRDRQGQHAADHQAPWKTTRTISPRNSPRAA